MVKNQTNYGDSKKIMEKKGISVSCDSFHNLLTLCIKRIIFYYKFPNPCFRLGTFFQIVRPESGFKNNQTTLFPGVSTLYRKKYSNTTLVRPPVYGGSNWAIQNVVVTANYCCTIETKQLKIGKFHGKRP